MIKNVLSGLAIGIVNIIPGVSGGTMMVILGVFDDIMEAIAKIFSKKSLIFLGQIFLGALIGIVGFAKIIEYLFENYEAATIYWFIGLIAFSIPLLIKKEMKTVKVSKLFLVFGAIIILGISLLAPENTEKIITSFPALNLPLLIEMLLLGIVAGATTIFPGISGSMVLLILGKYYLYKSYLANATTLDTNIIVPLGVIGIGIIIGIIGGGKITDLLLRKYKRATMSLILGLVIMSALVLVPLDIVYNARTIITCIGSFLFGGILVMAVEKISKKKTA